MIPDPPRFTAAEMQRCRADGDYKPILFEWYKFVGSLCCVVAFIQPDSPAYRMIPPEQYYVIAGLMNRCARLILSNVALSHEGKFGETTSIVDRCIFESAVKLIWLCHCDTNEEFNRYLADGLKTELELKARIKSNVASNSGTVLPIEARMLNSIDNHIRLSRMTEEEIRSTKKQRDLAAMIEGLKLDRLIYIVAQKIGSHHIHGSWPSLLFHYLEKCENTSTFKLSPSPGPYSTHINQFMFVPFIVLRAMASFVTYTLQDDEAQKLCSLFTSTENDIMAIYAQAGEDAQ